MTRNQRFNSHSQTQTKKQERAIRDAHRKEKKINSYLADDENFPSFVIQLKKMGLQLRDIPGDGNCLFRALGDQLDGHCRDHYRHRQETVQYMLDHRYDFEPFVEDDVPFDEHINNLGKLGTHAGNDAIVAFAKLHNRNVMIHQLNGKPLMIQGPAGGSYVQQLHIAYHNGDHYSSIRRQGDSTETPASIHLQDDTKPSAPFSSSGYSGHDDGDVSRYQCLDDLTAEVMNVTGHQDEDLVRETLEDCDLDVDATIAILMQTLELGDHVPGECDDLPPGCEDASSSGIWAPEGTGSRLFGGEMSGNNGLSNSNSNRGGGARPKNSASNSVAQRPGVSGRRAREAKKMEKKRRAEERHRQRILGINGPQQEEPHQDDMLVIKHDITRI